MHRLGELPCVGGVVGPAAKFGFLSSGGVGVCSWLRMVSGEAFGKYLEALLAVQSCFVEFFL